MMKFHDFIHGMQKVEKVAVKVGVIAVEDGLPIAATVFPVLAPVAVAGQILTGGSGMKGMGGWLIKMLSLIPYVVSGIEQIHGESKTGTEKKQLAMEALGLATTTALTLEPGQATAIQAAAALASDTIDGVKNVYNAVKSSSAAAAAPATATATAPSAKAATADGFSIPS